MTSAIELHADGIAAIVLDGARPRRTSVAVRRSELNPDGVAIIALGTATHRTPWLPWGLATALLIHAGLAMITTRVASSAKHSDGARRTRPAMLMALEPERAPAAHEHLEPPHKPSLQPRTTGRIHAAVRPVRAARAMPTHGTAPADVVANREVAPAVERSMPTTAAAPIDLSAGESSQYAGSVIGPPATSQHPAAVGGGAASAKTSGSLQVPRARPIGLPDTDWDCPWPREANSLVDDEQLVVVRVAVAADGRVTSARLESDPGYGFGPIALECARARRFRPALDEHGRPFASLSPPIRIRFTRSAN